MKPCVWGTVLPGRTVTHVIAHAHGLNNTGIVNRVFPYLLLLSRAVHKKIYWPDRKLWPRALNLRWYRSFDELSSNSNHRSALCNHLQSASPWTSSMHVGSLWFSPAVLLVKLCALGDTVNCQQFSIIDMHLLDSFWFINVSGLGRNGTLAPKCHAFWIFDASAAANIYFIVSAKKSLKYSTANMQFDPKTLQCIQFFFQNFVWF